MLHLYSYQFHPATGDMELFFEGCSFRCPGCHNSELWEARSNTLIEPHKIVEVLEEYLPVTKRIMFMGGEPLQQDPASLLKLLELLQIRTIHLGIKYVLFTGYTIEDPIVKPWIPCFNIFKFGQYMENIPGYFDDILGVEIASSNQEVWTADEIALHRKELWK